MDSYQVKDSAGVLVHSSHNHVKQSIARVCDHKTAVDQTDTQQVEATSCGKPRTVSTMSKNRTEHMIGRRSSERLGLAEEVDDDGGGDSDVVSLRQRLGGELDPAYRSLISATSRLTDFERFVLENGGRKFKDTCFPSQMGEQCGVCESPNDGGAVSSKGLPSRASHCGDIIDSPEDSLPRVRRNGPFSLVSSFSLEDSRACAADVSKHHHVSGSKRCLPSLSDESYESRNSTYSSNIDDTSSLNSVREVSTDRTTNGLHSLTSTPSLSSGNVDDIEEKTHSSRRPKRPWSSMSDEKDSEGPVVVSKSAKLHNSCELGPKGHLSSLVKKKNSAASVLKVESSEVLIKNCSRDKTSSSVVSADNLTSRQNGNTSHDVRGSSDSTSTPEVIKLKVERLSSKESPAPVVGGCQSDNKSDANDSERSNSQQSWPAPSLGVEIPDWMYVALDCEMVGVGPKGRTSVLGRCSIVDYGGNVVYDRYVCPDEPVTDYRTPWSGLRPHHLQGALSMADALREIYALLANKIIVGHSVYNDFRVLKMNPPFYVVRDTAQCKTLVRMARLEGQGNALKKLAAALLGRSIQAKSSGHCSVEDARATLDLFKLVRGDYEEELASKWLKKPNKQILNDLTAFVEKACATRGQRPRLYSAGDSRFLQDEYWPSDFAD